MFVKAYPILSLLKKDTDANEVVVKIENPSDSTEDVTLSGFIFSTVPATLSLNDQTITPSDAADIPEAKRITLAAGESTELRFEAATDKTIQLTGVIVTVDSNTYTLSDDYTNVAKWADLKITYKK
ncbi:hypothetical protein IJU97_03205 [bacterium]|nr:hypothetical protein [bacterium]